MRLSSSECTKMRLRPELCPGPHWGYKMISCVYLIAVIVEYEVIDDVSAVSYRHRLLSVDTCSPAERRTPQLSRSV